MIVVASLQTAGAETSETGFGRHAEEPTQTAAIKEYGFALAPLSFVKFCMNNTAQCETRPGVSGKTLTLAELRSVNSSVNRAIDPRKKPTDPLLAQWTVEASQGDCNDYAVTKRHRLIAAGWPSAKLRLAVVVTESGQGHLVLVASLPEGEVVLDNLSDAVKPWDKLGYDWVSIQTSDNPRFWAATGERGWARQMRLQALLANVTNPG